MNNLLPIYFQIKQTIKSWILNKEFGLGEKIPSENDLAEKFKVSRLTVRQAIAQLVQEGFLTSRRGEGTFVTRNENLVNQFSLEFSGFMDDLFYHQISKVNVKSASVSVVIPTRPIREKLELGPKEKEVVQLKRVRCQGDQPFTYTINYLPMEIGAKITEEALYQKPLLKILEQDMGFQFTEAVQTIEASFSNQEIAENLSVLNGSPILFVERIMYGPKRKPIELFQCSYRADMYRFIVRLKNIRGKSGNKWIQRQIEP